MSDNVLPPTTCTLETCSRDNSFLRYAPNLAGNVLYLSLFAVLLIAQTGLGLFYRTWGFIYGMFCGLLLEVIGYAGRLILRKNPFLIDNFLLYFIPLGLGPAFLCCSIYLTIARVTVVYSGTTSTSTSTYRFSTIAPRSYAIIFCALDILALCVQGVGGGLTATASTKKSQDNSTYILIAGLALQAASLLGFLIAAGDVFRRVRASTEEQRTQDPALVTLRQSHRWRLFLLAVGAAALLIFVRTVYRVAELSGGFTGELANEEVPFMILEGPMVIIAVFLLTLFHPGVVFRGGAWAASDFVVRKKNAGVMREGEEEKRLWCAPWLRKRRSGDSGATMIDGDRDVERAGKEDEQVVIAEAKRVSSEVTTPERVILR